MKFISTPITQIKVGDIINVNTGYRPLDDENCKVLKIKREIKGLFPQDTISFFIKSYHGDHWYDVPVYGQRGGCNCPIVEFEYNLTKVLEDD